MGFGVRGLGFRGLGVRGLGFRALGCGVESIWCQIQGSGYYPPIMEKGLYWGLWGNLRFRVLGFRIWGVKVLGYILANGKENGNFYSRFGF